jgi:hypothetical protein
MLYCIELQDFCTPLKSIVAKKILEKSAATIKNFLTNEFPHGIQIRQGFQGFLFIRPLLAAGFRKLLR